MLRVTINGMSIYTNFTAVPAVTTFHVKRNVTNKIFGNAYVLVAAAAAATAAAVRLRTILEFSTLPHQNTRGNTAFTSPTIYIYIRSLDRFRFPIENCGRQPKCYLKIETIYSSCLKFNCTVLCATRPSLILMTHMPIYL